MSDQKQNRRCYENGQCPFHSMLQDQVNKSLPRWVFVSAFSTLIMIAIVFAGWHVNSIAAIDKKYEKQITVSKEITQENREILIELRANQRELIKKFDRIYNGR